MPQITLIAHGADPSRVFVYLASELRRAGWDVSRVRPDESMGETDVLVIGVNDERDAPDVLSNMAQARVGGTPIVLIVGDSHLWPHLAISDTSHIRLLVVLVAEEVPLAHIVFPAMTIIHGSDLAAVAEAIGQLLPTV